MTGVEAMTEQENATALYWPEPTGFWREPDGAMVTLTGDLPHWRRHISEQGHTYATGVLRLLDGDVPLMIPPETYRRVGGLIGEDARLTVTGRVDRRGPIHLVAVLDVTEPDRPGPAVEEKPAELIPWEDLTPGRVVTYRHHSRARRLAGRPMLLRRGRIHAVYPDVQHGQVTVTPLNKDGSRNKSLGYVSLRRGWGEILSVEPLDEQAP